MVKFEDLEIWDHIKGYEGLYKVSSKGRVWSIKYRKYFQPYLRTGYPSVDLRKDGIKKKHRIHRLVALTFYFVDDDTLMIDHIDRDKTNNNLLNLRFCTDSGNNSNMGLKQNNTSGFKGVCWCKKYNKWISRITVNSERKFLGYFNTKEEAYEAYKKASQEYHKDFGYAP